MARFVIAMILLLVMPAGSAALLADSSPLSPALNDFDLVDTDSVIDELPGGLEIPEIPELCRSAVELELHWAGGMFTDHRENDASWIQAELITETISTLVPIYEEVTRQTGLLDLLSPVTETVTELVGYDEVIETVVHEVPVGVHLAWEETYVDWTNHVDRVLVTLPVGLPFLANTRAPIANAEITQVCDSDAEILTYVPSPDSQNYDVYMPGHAQDGWLIHVLSLEAWLADEEDVNLLPFKQSGYIIHAGRLMADTPENTIVDAVADAVNEALDDFEAPEVPEEPEEAPEEQAVSHQANPSGIGLASLAAIGGLVAIKKLL